MIRRASTLIAALLLIAAQARAFDFVTNRQDGGQPGAFLNYAASARSLGLGRAYTGVADDAAATYWNAAGLSQITRKDMVSLYSALEENTNIGLFSYAQPSVDYGTFGLSVINLRSSGFERRDAVTGDATGSYDMSESAFLFSNGFRTAGKWSLGSTVKVIRQQIDTNSGMGYGLDLSSLYPINSKLKVGLVMNNIIAPSVRLQSEKESYPRELRTGLAFLPTKSWLVSTDFTKSENRSMKMNLGTEVMLNSLVAVRAGIADNEITAGLGFTMGDWNLDYAIGHYQTSGSVGSFGDSHRIGVHFKFGSDIADTGTNLRWANKGHECLEALAVQMSTDTSVSDPKLQTLLQETADVIRNRGYSKPQDLYAAQGYISYFKGEYDRSAQSLAEAVSLDPQNPVLAQNLEKARVKMTEEQVAKAVSDEMVALKKAYAAQNWRAAITSGKKILSLNPGNVEATTYLEDAQTRQSEPINRAIKIARAKMANEEYLDAVKQLHDARQLDPENKEAADLMSQAIDALEKGSQATAASTDHHVEEISRDSQKSRESYSKGLQYYSQGKIQDAVVAWKDAVRYDGTNTSAQKAYERASLELSQKP